MKLYLTITALVTTVLFSTFTWAGMTYTAVIDAGSTGSRLYLFQYEKTKQLPVIKTVFSKTIDIPLASYKDTPEKAGEAVAPLLNSLMDFLNEQYIDPKTVTLALYATAGMRLLSEPAQDAIYLQLESYIPAHYTFVLDDVDTLSPENEALLGWIDVNYLLGNFQNRTPTVGSIDVGGASVEIAFEDRTSTYDHYIFTIDGRRYTIFAANFLSLGVDEARKAMNVKEKADVCYPLNYKLNDTLTGDFNQTQCKALYMDVLHPFSLNLKIPAVTGKSFVAFSSVYYLYHDFNIEKTPYQPLLDEKIADMCTLPLEEINKNYSAINVKYRTIYCANGSYLSVLLYDTLGLEGSQLTITNKLNGEPVNWALGVVLMDALQ